FWSGPGLDSTGLIFDPVLAGAGMHSMIYQYTDQGCMISDTAYIEVAGILAADQVSCSSSGDTLSFSWPQQLNDTAYVVNVLNGPDGFMDGNSYHIPGLSFGDSASVSITVQSDGPCGAYEVFAECALTTPDCPSINLPADTFICNGASVVLDFIDTLAWTNYEWAPEVSISCTDCAHPTVSPEINTTYQVIVSNSNGCTDTVDYTVYVQVFPTSYIPDEPIKFCPGESFELCMPDGDLHYWIGPNTFISTDQCLFFSELTAANEGNYYAFMRANGCRFLKAFKLEAAPELQVEVTPNFQTICPNDTFSLSATAPNAVDFNWSPANYLDCPECPVTTGAIPQTGTFILTVTDSFGCTATDQAVVFVDDCGPAPRPSQQADTNRLAVFPNPASDRMELITGLTGVKTIEIWSITGQFRGSVQFEGQHHLVTVDHLSPGPYIIRVSNTEQSELVRLIINR
ncbi:MAG: T9SS type A sorting domain-containing protein, partial [Mameliella sp.]|nr:T9SS type A sorting domain-containing protein [Phaeodactylibacter sp.]